MVERKGRRGRPRGRSGGQRRARGGGRQQKGRGCRGGVGRWKRWLGCHLSLLHHVLGLAQVGQGQGEVVKGRLPGGVGQARVGVVRAGAPRAEREQERERG